MKKALLSAPLVLAAVIVLRANIVSAEPLNVTKIVQIAVVSSQPKNEDMPEVVIEAPEPISTVVPTVPEQQQIKETIETVQSGDTLSRIADKHNISYKRIFDANSHIKNPNIINPGDRLRIPSVEEVIPERELPPAPVIVVSSQKPLVKASTSEVAPAPAVSNGNVWDALAACESGSRWNVNTGNGYYGGLQFNYGTWKSNGGGQYAERADLATREQQIDIASRVQSGRGFAPWPACARKLGLL